MLVNGQSFGFFRSTRGVKQGDHLSPVLFIIVVEVMSRGLNRLFTTRNTKDIECLNRVHKLTIFPMLMIQFFLGQRTRSPSSKS